MIGSAITAILTYISKISVPAPHGGFIVLPIVFTYKLKVL